MTFDVWGDTDIRLTGRTRVRTAIERVGLFERRTVLVLQFEESYRRQKLPFGQPGEAWLRWRDARVGDLPIRLGQEFKVAESAA